MNASLPQEFPSSDSVGLGSKSRPPVDTTRLERERQEQFRLVRIQSFNWGTFHGLLKLDVSEKGMLFIGPSGSGKSTIFDSHAALLTPPRWLHYNVAARESESKQDRNALTYLRGVWGEQTAGTGEIAQQQLRPGPTWAAISEVYRNGRDETVTLVHVYWIKGTSNELRQVEKRYIVADRLFELSELEFFPESGFNVRRFKADLVDAWDTPDFPVYQERMRSRLGIETENALKLLHKTQSAKNLGSLTDFLRDFMLDEPKTHEMAQELVSQFGRLENAHNEVVSAARQIATLLPAREFNQERETKIAARSSLQEARTGIDLVAAELLHTLRLERKESLEARRQAEEGREALRQQEVDAARTTLEGHKQRREGLGGQQLTTLETSQRAAEQEQADRSQRHTKVADACRHLGLTMPVQSEKYAELASQGRRELPSALAGQDGLSQQRQDLAVLQHERKKEHEAVLAEIATLARRPSSKMGAELSNMRRRITDALELDESALPFAGELIEVMPAEKGWQGPIERVLKGFSRTLLVPEHLYLPVSKFVNATHLHGRLVYLRMLPHNGRMPAPKPDGLFRKVAISQGDFQRWVQDELLQYFDAELVEGPEDLNGVSFGITRGGLFKANNKRHEKDDRSAVNDARNWVLGADSRAKAKAYQDREAELRLELDTVKAQLLELDRKEQARVTRALHWQTLVNFSWEEIDHASSALRAAELAAQIRDLRASSPDLDILEAKIKEAGDALKKAEDAKKAQDEKTAEVRVKLNILKEAMDKAAAFPTIEPTPLQRTTVHARLDAGERDPTIESMSEDMRYVDKVLGKELGELDTEITKLHHRIEQKFADYNKEWEAEAEGLDPTLASYDEYDAKLTRLQVDDLPRFEVRFRELLSEQSNQHVALLSNQLEQERKDISDRMDTVNESLARAEYNKGTHLLIEVEEHTPPQAQELKADLRAALSQSLGMDDKEAEARFQAMKKLVRRLASQDPQQVSWRKLALDVRLHVEFIARELDEDGREVQVHRSGAGKSGGQRQKLTATCLAAALRYQLGGPGRLLPTFATVFLDEAFDKADADFTDAAMKIFKSFGFQLIIATPIKSVMTIEPYVGGAVYIHIKDRKHSRALALPYDVESERIDFRSINGSSANDEKP